MKISDRDSYRRHHGPIRHNCRFVPALNSDPPKDCRPRYNRDPPASRKELSRPGRLSWPCYRAFRPGERSQCASSLLERPCRRPSNKRNKFAPFHQCPVSAPDLADLRPSSKRVFSLVGCNLMQAAQPIRRISGSGHSRRCSAVRAMSAITLITAGWAAHQLIKIRIFVFLKLNVSYFWTQRRTPRKVAPCLGTFWIVDRHGPVITERNRPRHARDEFAAASN
jgi:hypothetical protein